MKRLMSLILLATIGASLCSCSYFGKKEAGTTTTTVYVSYDYGRIQKGKITTLFNGCFIDFEYTKPDKTLIPGDLVIFKHTGYMLSTMSYPGNTQLSDGVIKEVTYKYSEVRELSADKIKRNEEGRVVSVLDADGVKHVIINENYDFISLSEYDGNTLFASYDEQGIAALFSFNPRG